MDVKGLGKRGIQIIAGVSVLGLVGCVTLDTPKTQYVLTGDGFKEVGKLAEPIQTETGQPVTTATPSKTVNSQSAVDASWTTNKEGGWGFCCRLGRGLEPTPMSAFEFTYPVDVDTAYLKLKREFDFISREDLAKKPFVQNYMEEKRLFHLRYEATPGVHYKMRNFVEHAYGAEEPANTIEIELFKEGAEKVNVRVVYYAGNTKNARGYEASLKQRIEKTIGNASQTVSRLK